MQPVADQITAFLLLVLWGNLVGGFFDCYRFFRLLWRPKKWGTNLGDAFFWLFVTVFTYLYLLRSTWGEVRLYVFLGIGLGLFIYLNYFSKYMLIFIVRVYLVLKKLVALALRLTLPPLRFFFKVLLLPVTIAASFLSIFIRGARHLCARTYKAVKRLCGLIRPPAPPADNCL